MNRTHIEHAIIALVIQTVAAFITGSWGWGAALAIAVFIAREHAQREFEIGQPHLLKGYEAFDFWNWSTDGKLDVLVPVAVTVAAAVIVEYAL